MSRFTRLSEQLEGFDALLVKHKIKVENMPLFFNDLIRFFHPAVVRTAQDAVREACDRIIEALANLKPGEQVDIGEQLARAGIDNPTRADKRYAKRYLVECGALEVLPGRSEQTVKRINHESNPDLH